MLLDKDIHRISSVESILCLEEVGEIQEIRQGKELFRGESVYIRSNSQ